jgi:hypothetical protein
MFCSLSILTVADDGSKQRYINNENWSDWKTWIPEFFYLKKIHNNCENLNIWLHAKISGAILNLNIRLHAKSSGAILKNPYYTPCNMAHIILLLPLICKSPLVYYDKWLYIHMPNGNIFPTNYIFVFTNIKSHRGGIYN